ncbi:hypothetical protein Mapa_000771 [Marchantia paleacea]|nr:hypothetical protein Mapa_000771 [Marchantia paleacea]
MNQRITFAMPIYDLCQSGRERRTSCGPHVLHSLSFDNCRGRAMEQKYNIYVYINSNHETAKRRRLRSWIIDAGKRALPCSLARMRK